jgi:hypothetical protein
MVYKDSVMALQKILASSPSEVQTRPPAISPCRLTLIPPEITYFSNGVEYYYVEVTCDDGKQYAIQGYGEEAEALFNEAHKCTVCGNPIGEDRGELFREQNRDGRLVLIDNTCRVLKRKFESIYGLEFFRYR